MEEEQILDLLKTLRHEWLNRLQLVRAYGAIGDEAAIDVLSAKYREQATREGLLSTMNLPKTALLLMRAEWSGLAIDYDVIRRPEGISDERLAEITEAAIQTIAIGEGEVSLTFHEGVTIEIYRDHLDVSRITHLVTPMEIESQTSSECVIEIQGILKRDTGQE